MKNFDVKDHEPSILPDGYDFELVWNDEFDGEELDRTKWDYRRSMMGENWRAWTDKGVTVEDGCAVFRVVEEDGRPVSSQLQTGYNFMDEPIKKTKFADGNSIEDDLQWRIGKLKKSMFTHKYGYYECRCKLQQHPGWWTAFWIQSPIIGASIDPEQTGSEIDIMESARPGMVCAHNVFTGGYGLDMTVKRVGGGDIDKTEWHRFGLLWDENGYTFYVDGKEDGHISDYVSGCPEFVLISTEVRGYRGEDRCPTEEARKLIELNDSFIVDYVRVFDVKK